MDDLYANIRKDVKTGHDKALTVIIAGILVLAAVVLIVGGWVVGYNRVQGFCQKSVKQHHLRL
ncbi:MAG: hypothetical protein K2P22_02230 [Lachnospiraceae bacterium]|nr:hypothetical protein [Lachnospiraceae bacterium]